VVTPNLVERLSCLDPVLKNDWHVVAHSKAVVEGKPYGAKLLEMPVVVWRSGDRISAAYDLCFHRGTRLTAEGSRIERVTRGEVDTDCLICPYHGWHYDGDGRCVYIPAAPEIRPPQKAQLQMFHVKEKYGWVWVCMGEPAQDVPVIPEWDDPTFRNVLWGPWKVEAGGPRLVENFLDVAHFPYVHEGLLGDEDHTPVEDYQANLTNEGIVTSEIKVWQPNPDGTGVGTYSTYVYKVFRPLTGYFIKRTGGKFSIFFTVAPSGPRESVAWMCISMDYSAEMPDEEVVEFQDRIFEQDIPIVSAQFPEELPLDLATEVSARADRLSIRYRQWLSELGLTFSVVS
jgi:phenylpropionate dioxygenase-like ring-hydroxylating dioxygenase large terminal subunit